MLITTYLESFQKVKRLRCSHVTADRVTLATDRPGPRRVDQHRLQRLQPARPAQRGDAGTGPRRRPSELGYAGPDPLASSLRSGRVGAIGLIEKSLPVALTDPASLLMLSGVAEACDEAGVALVLIPRSRRPTPGPSTSCASAVVDGFVAHCDALDDERRLIVEERRLPIVVLDGRPEPGRAVGRHRRGGRHVRRRRTTSSQLGHRRLAVDRLRTRTASARTTPAPMRRLAGYRQAVAERRPRRRRRCRSSRAAPTTGPRRSPSPASCSTAPTARPACWR